MEEVTKLIKIGYQRDVEAVRWPCWKQSSSDFTYYPRDFMYIDLVGYRSAELMYRQSIIVKYFSIEEAVAIPARGYEGNMEFRLNFYQSLSGIHITLLSS